MNKVYQVVHHYDVDGGFGDAICCMDIVAIFASEEDAKEFVSKFSNEHVYDKPYDELYCGRLQIIEKDIIPAGSFSADDYDTSEMWWLKEDPKKPCGYSY